MTAAEAPVACLIQNCAIVPVFNGCGRAGNRATTKVEFGGLAIRGMSA